MVTSVRTLKKFRPMKSLQKYTYYIYYIYIYITSHTFIHHITYLTKYLHYNYMFTCIRSANGGNSCITGAPGLNRIHHHTEYWSRKGLKPINSYRYRYSSGLCTTNSFGCWASSDIWLINTRPKIKTLSRSFLVFFLYCHFNTNLHNEGILWLTSLMFDFVDFFPAIHVILN